MLNIWMNDRGGRLFGFLTAVCAVVVLCAITVWSSDLNAKTGRKIKYYPTGTPSRAIQDLDDMLDDFIVKKKGEKLTPKEETHNRDLKQKIIHGTFDIRELAKRSLGKHWGNRTEEERDHFVEVLTNLLEEKALFSKEQSAAKSKEGGKYFVVYRGHRYKDGTKTHAFVRTKVVIPAENIDIELNYRLKKSSNDWMIYDIIVDEASLVNNYRYQFNSIITKHGYKDLIRRMETKLDEFKKKRES